VGRWRRLKACIWLRSIIDQWLGTVAEATDQAYLVSMGKAVSIGVPNERRRSHFALMTAAGVAGLLLASAFALWAHYGTAVFYEMIVSGIAACL
jgi:hypothetical protein